MAFPGLLFIFSVFFVQAAPASSTCPWCAAAAARATLSSSSAVLDQDESYAVAAASPGFFEIGDGCGSCIELRCKNSRAKVVIMARTRSSQVKNTTVFVLSERSFADLTGGSRLRKIDVDYRRVPCDGFKNKNLSIMVDGGSRNPSNLDIRFLRQAGLTDIVAVDVATAGRPAVQWKSMEKHRRRGCPSWRTFDAPPGPLQLRLVVTAGSGGKWVWADGAVLPEDWAAGDVFDAGVQISDVGRESCACPPGRRRRRPS